MHSQTQQESWVEITCFKDIKVIKYFSKYVWSCNVTLFEKGKKQHSQIYNNWRKEIEILNQFLAYFNCSTKEESRYNEIEGPTIIHSIGIAWSVCVYNKSLNSWWAHTTLPTEILLVRNSVNIPLRSSFNLLLQGRESQKSLKIIETRV